MAFDLNHSDEQRQVLAAAAAMLNTHYPASRRRAEKQDDLQNIAQFGAFALGVSEGGSGAGLSIVDEAIIHVLFGRHLVSTSVLATAVAVRLASTLGQHDVAQRAAAGTVIICAGVKSEAAVYLVDPIQAEFAVVFDTHGLQLVALAGLPYESVDGLGHSVSLSRLEATASAVIGQSGDTRLRRIADLLICAQFVGVAEATRDLAVSYAKLRQQFGRAIGSFQAIKHHCADMAIGCEVLSSTLDMAAIAERDGRDDAAFQASALVLLAPKIALANARACIQIHGGIGFSAEADPHHYLKYAHVLRLLSGGTDILQFAAPLAPYSNDDERN